MLVPAPVDQLLREAGGFPPYHRWHTLHLKMNRRNKLAKLLIEDAKAKYTLQEYTYQKYAYKNGFKATYVDKDVFASGLIHVTQLLPPDKDHSCDYSYSCLSGRKPKVSGLQCDIVMQGVM